MNYIKNYSKAVLVSISMMIFLSLILTLFNYINIISVKVCYVLLKIVIFISIFIGSYLMGKNTKNKGWLEGIKFSLPFLLLFIFPLLEYSQLYSPNSTPSIFSLSILR